MKFAVAALISLAGAFDFEKVFSEKNLDKLEDRLEHPEHLGKDVTKFVKHEKHSFHHEMNKHHHGFLGKQFDKLRDFVKKEHHKDGEHETPAKHHPFGPPPGPKHPHCSAGLELEHPCDGLWKAMVEHIGEMHPGGKNPDPAGGSYKIVKRVPDKAIWAVREETFGKKGTFVWDLAFEFQEHPEPFSKNHSAHGCMLHTMSRIRNDTKTDADSDFCNLFNVFEGHLKDFSHIQFRDCPEHPERDEVKQACSKVMEEESLKMSPEQVTEFVAGIIDGLIGKNDLPELQKCMKDSANLDKDIEEAISDFTKGDVPDIIKGVEAIGRIIQEAPQDLQDCGDIQDDLNRIGKWAQIFEHPTQLVQTMLANAIANHEQVINDAQAIVSDFNAGNFVQAGEDVGDILIQLIGPVPKAKALEDLLQ